MIIHTAVPAVSTALLAILLVACGGSGGSAGNAAPEAPPAAAPEAPPAAPEAPPAAAQVLAAAAITGATDIEIDDYSLVSSTRISRTIYEYTYTVDASNWGTADATISAVLASSAAGITVMDGAVGFGDVAKGATEVSQDTFTIRQDRRQPFREDDLIWTVRATALTPTTFELIDSALASGAINAETALVYKVYYEFHDDRLPAAYRGRDDGFPEATAIHEAIDGYQSFSQATREILRPFLLPPNDPASWYQLRYAQQQPAQSRTRIAAVSPGASSNPAPASVGTPEDHLPGSGIKRLLITQSNGRVHVIWNEAYPDDRTTAFRIAGEIDLTIWPKLTALLGVPPVDFSGILQVHITDIEAMTLSYRRDAIDALGLATNRCGGIPIVYVQRGHPDIVQTTAHEIAHAIQARFPLSSGCSETAWLAEATATWAEHYTYPDANTEQGYAPYFLEQPALSLDNREGVREYGAYLWFLYVTRGDATGTSNAATQRVRSTWDALANHNSLGAVNAAVSDIEGLTKQWPEFALYNWNRKAKRRTIRGSVPPTTRISGAPYVYYGQWDGLIHKARESTVSAPASPNDTPEKILLDGTIFKGYPLRHQINPLGAKYWHFDFRDDQRIRRVRLKHPYSDGSQPWAKVQVIVKLRDKEWMPAEDWTGFERKTLCRDRDQPDEDFEEVVVVISNSEYTASNILDDSGAAAKTFIEVSALGCSNWIGKVEFKPTISGSSEELTESGEATDVKLEIELDRLNLQLFKLAGGRVDWKHSGRYTNSEGHVCSTIGGESEGGYLLFTAENDGTRWIAGIQGNPFSTPLLEPIYHLLGRSLGATPPDDYLCVDPQNDDYFGPPLYGSHDLWLDTDGGLFPSPSSLGLYDFDPTGDTLAGSSVLRDSSPTELGGTKTRTYTWLFTKNGTFSGEPEP